MEGEGREEEKMDTEEGMKKLHFFFLRLLAPPMDVALKISKHWTVTPAN